MPEREVRIGANPKEPEMKPGHIHHGETLLTIVTAAIALSMFIVIVISAA